VKQKERKVSYLHSRLVLMIISGLILAVLIRLFFPPGVDVTWKDEAGTFTPESLFRTFTDDPPEAHFIYGDKVIRVKGQLAASGDGYVLLGKDMEIVRCMLRQSIYDRQVDYQAGQEVILKGVCRGLNMTEVLLTQCIRVKDSKGQK